MKIEMNFDANGKLETSIEVGAYVAETPYEMLELLDTDYKGKMMPYYMANLHGHLAVLSLIWQELKDLAYTEKEAMTTRELRITLLKQMDEAIHNTGDEFIIMPWLSCGVPDGATQSDFEDIADDGELWTDCCKLFRKLLGGDLHD